MQKVIIPTEVFAYIDQGKNPTLYTKDCLERALQRNEQVKGKVEVYSQVWLEMTINHLFDLFDVTHVKMTSFSTSKVPRRANQPFGRNLPRFD